MIDTTNLRPYDFKTIPAKDPRKVHELSTDPIVGAKLDWLVERAQYMLGGIRPSSPYASKSRWMPWLTGTGYGSLPEDSPSAGVDSALLYNPDGMIRVYLFVEWDYMLDVVSHDKRQSKLHTLQRRTPMCFTSYRKTARRPQPMLR